VKFRGRLLVVSLVVAAVASVAIGWVIARSGGSDGTTTAPEAVITGPSGTFEPPSIATNAKVEGTPLPEANVRTLNNDAFAVADLLGQPLVINIWGSTCGPCKKELPDFAEAHAEYGDRVRFVGVSYLAASEREEDFARGYGIQYELFYDADGEFISAVGVAAFPVTLFVTADGTIVQQTGQIDATRIADIIEEELL